jgi:hypothetical protein
MISEPYVTHFCGWKKSNQYRMLIYLVCKNANKNPNKENGIRGLIVLAWKTISINKIKYNLCTMLK